jgi:TonB family protein
MKHPTGNVRPRRLAAPRTTAKKKIRLDLKRRTVPEPEDRTETKQTSPFWKWVGLVALLHVLVICGACLFYMLTANPKPPEQFISLLPEGTVVQGTPGAQEAHKAGPTTSAPTEPHASTPPTHTAALHHKEAHPPKPAEPPKMTSLAADKPVPKPPKVKVDLNLVDGPAPAMEKPKLKPHLKKPKPVLRPEDESTDDDRDSATNPDSTGLSKEQIAEKLGEKLEAAGIKTAPQAGMSGSANSHPNRFKDFYDSISDQAHSEWQRLDHSNLPNDPALDTMVQVHVENDGRVPPESVQLLRSSGNASFDDSVLAAVKNLGYLHDPLPDGCPPDISINFKPTP